MWAGGLCSLMIGIVALVGLEINNLVSTTGTSDNFFYEGEVGKMHVYATFAELDFSLDVKYPNDDRDHSTVTYAACKKRGCSNSSYTGEYSDSDFCDELKHMNHTGHSYFALYITGLTLVFVVFAMSIIVTIAEKYYRFDPDTMHCRVVSTLLLFCAMTFFLAAFFVFYFLLIQDWSDTMTFIFWMYYPDVSALVYDWTDGEIEASLVILLVVVLLLFCNFPLMLFVGKKDDPEKDYEIVVIDEDEVNSTTPHQSDPVELSAIGSSLK